MLPQGPAAKALLGGDVSLAARWLLACCCLSLPVQAMASLVEDFNLVNFIPLDVSDKHSMARVRSRLHGTLC